MAVYIISYIYLLSGGIRVRNLQELDVVAFWSRNLDVVVFQSWNLNVMAFCPLKKMPWNHDFLAYLSPFLDVVVFPNLVVPESWSRSFLVLESRCRGFLVLESQCRGTSFSLLSWKQKKSRIIMSIMLLKNISIDQIYATSICIMYA